MDKIRWEDVEEAFRAYEQQWRKMKRIAVSGMVFGFLLTPVVFAVGVMNVVRGRTVWGFIVFVLCGIDALSTANLVRSYRRGSAQFEEIKMKHLVARNVHRMLFGKENCPNSDSNL